MRSRATLATLIILLSMLSGCMGLFGRDFEDHLVFATRIDTTGWNTDGVFSVHVQEPEIVFVEITATAADGRTLRTEAPSNETLAPVELAIPDGTWTIRYTLDGKRWETFEGARFDSTAPTLTGLQTLGDAVAGSYRIGEGVTVEPDATVQVIDQDTNVTIARSLPTPVSGLQDGIHAFDVIVTDPAGNSLVEQVMVRAGSVTFLPKGQATLGVVARYTLGAEVWDISDLDSWILPETARVSVDDAWLGSGRAIAPLDARVQEVVQDVVDPGMSSGEIAFALYRWMADELDYDKTILDRSTLLQPHQTMLDTEDAGDLDADGDGFVRNGSGNGVRGGVCRDLAALYVSLLRGAGVPSRLVTGYLGGEVNGFHAWVEFYGGDGHGPAPWVPVDVSAIGSSSDPAPYTPEVALQAFGMRHTGMLPLRIISEAQEDDEWSTAVSMRKKWSGDEPPVSLVKDFRPETKFPGVLCVNMATLRREAIAGETAGDCGSAYTAGIKAFVLNATHILDYGAEVGASDATSVTVTLTLSIPIDAAVAPGRVEWNRYGDAKFTDSRNGVWVGTWKA